MNRFTRRVLIGAAVVALVAFAGSSTALAQGIHVGFHIGPPGYYVYTPYAAVPPPVVAYPPPPVVVYRPPVVVSPPPVVVARPPVVHFRYGPVRGPRVFW